jgi:hypothetical protein
LNLPKSRRFNPARARSWAGVESILLHTFEASDVVVMVMTAIVVILVASLQFSRRSSAPPPDQP